MADSSPLSAFATVAGIESLHDLILDFDAQGRLVGIEVMNAKKVLPGSRLAEAKRI